MSFGPGSILNQLGFPSGYGVQGAGGRPNPRAYDEYLKAYHLSFLDRRQRDNVTFGGKIIMPPSALARLTRLDLESPWMFQLRNPANSAASTHAGVLEFIAEEGCVHLPNWMMKTLRLEDGDPIRITGAELQKGKLVKLQAQSTHFLEISDPKAVLEQALRNFSALTQGDIIEILYNSIQFDLLVMEATPGGGGINILDTDLEVDFAAPVGYVEPERPKAAPIPTMAEKLKIDLNSHSPGSSRPGSSLSGGFAGTSSGQTTVSKNGDHWESFKGKGETLNGRKTKGKGISHRKVEEVAAGSRIIRTDSHKIVSNNTLEEDVKVPAALNLPFGQLFFGFNVAAYVPPETSGATTSSDAPATSSAFTGTGTTLNGRSQPSSSTKGKAKESAETQSQSSYVWSGSGNSLGGGHVGAGGARVPLARSRQSNNRPVEKERSPTPDFGVDDDDDVIMIDSD